MPSRGSLRKHEYEFFAIKWFTLFIEHHLKPSDMLHYEPGYSDGIGSATYDAIENLR